MLDFGSVLDISAALRSATHHGLWDWIAAIATAMTVTLALFGGWVALASYVTTSRFNATVQMHEVFREYLRMQSDGLARDLTKVSAEDRVKLARDQAGFLLYTLEEMVAWISRERDALDRWPDRFFVRHNRSARADMINAWEATVITHLHKMGDLALESMLEYSSCYSVRFLGFASAHIRCRKLEQLVECSEHRVGHSLARRIGTIERQQRGRASRSQMSSACCQPFISSLLPQDTMAARYSLVGCIRCDGKKACPPNTE